MPPILFHRTALVGLVLGAAYGIAARWVVDSQRFGEAFAVMTFGFVFLVPFAMGYLTVAAVERPSRRVRVLAPWVPCGLTVLVAAAVGWEGAICVVMALPAMLLFASIGGVLAAAAGRRRRSATPLVALLPWAIMPLEQGRVAPERLVRSVTSIEIDAPPERVWPLVVSVDTIRPAERRPALFTVLGFPTPIAATLDREGVGGARTASFERGVVFREVVTAWEPGRRISFTIDADAVPPDALDPHVTIGGPFFDVLTGTYELQPLAGGRTRLVLHSEHRVSTAFNVYAAWWAERVMQSIQRNILGVLRARAEQGV